MTERNQKIPNDEPPLHYWYFSMIDPGRRFEKTLDYDFNRNDKNKTKFRRGHNQSNITIYYQSGKIITKISSHVNTKHQFLKDESKSKYEKNKCTFIMYLKCSIFAH